MNVVAVLAAAYATVTAVLFGAAFVHARHWQKKARLTAELLPQIRSSLVNYVSGYDGLAALRSFLIASRGDVVEAMLGFQDAVAGSARDRLSALAVHLGLLKEWRRAVRSHDLNRRRDAFAGIAFVCAYEPCRPAAVETLVGALEDSDPEIRVGAARALARFGTGAQAELVFRMAARGSLATRVFVAGPLRAHALELSGTAVADALRSGNAAQILAALEMVVAWERALPLTGLAEMVGRPEPAIRIQALRAATLVAASPDNESAAMQALADPDAEVAMAAASAVGRMRIVAAAPLLAECCRGGNAALARAAAAAMAALPQGWQALEELSVSEDPAIRATAAEAMAHVRAAKGFRCSR